MRTIIQTIAAGQSADFSIAGGRFEILSCIYPVTVSLQNANGTEITNGKAQNIEAGSYIQPVGGFDRIVISSDITQQIKFIISSGEAGTRSIAGTVQVVDGGKARTLANQAFSGAAAVAAVAGQLAVLQVWNPAGSGKNILISKYYVSSNTAGTVRAGWNTAVVGALGDYASKKAGGANAAARQSYGNLAAGPVGFQYNMQANIAASQTKEVEMEEPIVLPPGYGFCVQHTTPNTDLNATFEFCEEAN